MDIATITLSINCISKKHTKVEVFAYSLIFVSIPT